MIYYSNRQLWRLLCHAHGSSLAQRSVLARSLLLALFAAALAAVRHFVLLPRGISFLRDASPVLQHAVDIATGLLALLLVFRLYAAHQQWQKGVDSVSAVGEAARTLLSSACSFVHFSKRDTLAAAAAGGEDVSSSQKAIRSKSQFIRDLKRYVLIYITLVFHDCHDSDAPLELRQLLTEKEAHEFLSTDVQSLGENTWNRQRNVVGSANKLRAAVVELWLRRTVNRALQKQFLCAEQAVELNRIISTFPQMYTRVFNLSTVPIPFNYAQYLRFAIVAYMVLFSFAHVPAAEWYTPLWVFPCAVLVFALDNVASEIECPFGSDANDIDLEARILCIQDELKVILQAHFHSIGYSAEFFAAEDRMASLSSLLSVDVPKRKRSRASSIATSYTSSVAGSSKDSVVVQHQKEQRSPSREERASPVGIHQQEQHILLAMPSDMVASYGSCDANDGFINAAKHEQKHIAV